MTTRPLPRRVHDAVRYDSRPLLPGFSIDILKRRGSAVKGWEFYEILNYRSMPRAIRRVQHLVELTGSVLRLRCLATGKTIWPTKETA